MCAILTAAVSSHGQFTVFATNGDESVFTGSAQTDPIPDPLTASGWGVMSSSNLDGDAIRMWDLDGTRAEIEYDASSPFTSYAEFNFDGYIESDLTGTSQYMMRLGPSGLNWAALSNSSMEFRFRHNNGGQMMIRTSTSQTFDLAAVGLDTRFSVSILANAAATGGSSVDYNKDGIIGTLAPEEYAVIVNGSLVGTYSMFAGHTDNLGGFWLASGTSAAGTVATMQLDNITAVPEPSVYALIAGILGLGIVVLRRRRR